MIGTALTEGDKKAEINLAFVYLLYARDQEDFDLKLINWEEEVKGIEVATGYGAKKTYVLLSEYFTKNWLSNVPM